MYYAIKRESNGNKKTEKAFKSYAEAWKFYVNNDFDEVVSKDSNGYILETLNSK